MQLNGYIETWIFRSLASCPLNFDLSRFDCIQCHHVIHNHADITLIFLWCRQYSEIYICFVHQAVLNIAGKHSCLVNNLLNKK